jgi:hypothetical protein
MQAEFEWRVSDLGATVVICHNSDGSVPEAVLDWEEKVEEKEREAKAQDLSSFPLDGGAAPAKTIKRVPSLSGSEQGSLSGTTGTAMKDQLGAMLGLFRRSVTEPVKRN